MTAALSLPLVGSAVNAARPVTIQFQGQPVPAFEGQTIAAALYAAGVRTFTRSFKYHRPRGLLCVSGDCPNCLMNVDGRPNVRTCTERVRDGQVIESQHAWPSLDFDALNVFDKLSALLPVGFYYKKFHKPRWIWPIFEHTVRHVAGLGRIDVHQRAEAVETQVEHLQTGVCVVGAGPAGLAAAAAAAEAGADVTLLDRESRIGGHLLYDGDAAALPPLANALADRPNVRVLLDTTAFGLYEANLIGAFQRDRLLKIRAEQVIVATGGRQRPMLFANNDLPGVMLGRGVLRLARLYGVRAGRHAVVVTDCDDGHRLAEQLLALGISVSTVVDSRASAPSSSRFNTLSAHRVLAAHGRGRVRSVRVAHVNDGSATSGEQRLDCDLVCLAPRLTPANELLHQGGLRFTYCDGRWKPNRAVPGLDGAGAAAGTFDLVDQISEGRLRGQQAASALGHGYAPAVDPDGRNGNSAMHVPPTRLPETDFRKCFVCLCEDVTVKDLDRAIAEGFDHIETLKRYATVGMGPCQGKMCGQLSTEVCARITGQPVGAVGTTTSRPPMVPVELAVLAAEKRHHAVRRTPMHHWHEQNAACWLDAGLWKRPESYGNPAGEVRAVRQAVGVIDVSTLGKIDVLGPDAAELLERICINGWRDLAVGRTRYAALCNEEGILFDDGVAGRLRPEHYYLTATTGNAEGVFQWIERWRLEWRLQATVVNLTSAMAGVNLAGPKARDVLRKLTAFDLSPTAFPYSTIREAEVAGVPCRLLRVGFVGELGYEIHCSNAHGLHLWESLVAAGTEFGIRPFGVEAQRILRLEKGHLIVGQDTDALTNPFGAGLGKLVKFSKPAFHGRAALLKLRETRGLGRLVGITLPVGLTAPGDNAWARSLEGCQVIEQGRSVGRVTSVRFSPTMDRYIGLAWTSEQRSRPGTRIVLRSNQNDLPAEVTELPFYDPEGVRLRS